MILLRVKEDNTWKYVCLDRHNEVFVSHESQLTWQFMDHQSAERVARFITMLDLFKKYQFEVFDTEIVSAN